MTLFGHQLLQEVEREHFCIKQKRERDRHRERETERERQYQCVLVFSVLPKIPSIPQRVWYFVSSCQTLYGQKYVDSSLLSQRGNKN